MKKIFASFKNKIPKIFKNEWTVTLVSTMLGVIFGLYSTHYFENKQLQEAKNNALEEVRKEISKNEVSLKKYNREVQRNFEGISKITHLLNEKLEIIIHKDSLTSFKNNTSSVFSFSGFEPLTENKIRIKGDLNFNIDSYLIYGNLSRIVWDSYKQTNYTTITKFDCLTDIESLYDLQNEVNILNQEWRKGFLNGKFIFDKKNSKSFMRLWRQIILTQKSLINVYNAKDEIIKNCN